MAVMLVLSADAASTFDAETVTAPSVSTCESVMVASSPLPMTLLAYTSAMATLMDAAPAPPAATLAEASTAKMSDRSSALTVTAPGASTSLPPLMLASTVLEVVLIAATRLTATLTDTAPAPPAETPTAKANASIWLSAEASTLTAPPVVSTMESSMLASRLPPISFCA